MSRKKKGKRHTKNQNHGARKDKQARVLQRGPLRISQQDHAVVFENLATPNQHKQILQHAADIYPDVCKQIADKVAACRDIVRSADPKHLLMFAYWHFLHCYVGADPEESKTTRDQITSVRLLEYLQMLVCGTTTVGSTSSPSQKEFTRLRRTVEELYDLLNMSYFITRSAHESLKPDYNADLDQFKVLTEMNWLNVRGNRYMSQDVPHLDEFLAPHGEILQDVFGVSVREILDGVDKLLQSFSHGVREAVLEFDSFRSDTLDKIDAIFRANDTRDADPPELMNRVIIENGWEERRDRVFGRLFGFDLCDVITITGWPLSFAIQLAVGPGEDSAFDQGDRASWPTQFSLARVTPFIALDGRPYFFNVHGLTDNLYRVLERLIKAAKPSYGERWNAKQKIATETGAMRLINELLPGAKSIRSACYWAEDGISERTWTESDGVVIYDRTLFIVEAKGGAYTGKPPGPYIDAHINSMKKLVRDAIKQAKRFKDTLTNKGTLELFDEHRNLLCTLSRDEFDQIVLCCATLDHIDHLASHAEDLKTIGIDLSIQPVWCVSIDDLRVYADVFKNPLMFLDFLYEHMAALKLESLRVMDEMDHLGLYLEHNRYTMRFEQGASKFVWSPHGYRDKLDAFYSEIWKGRSAKPPTQEMPLRLKQIIDFLANSNREWRTAAARTLLCMDGPTRDQFCDSIDNCLNLQEELSRPRPYSTHGDVRITVAVNQKQSVSMDFESAVDHALAVMRLAGDRDRAFFHLTFSPFGLLENVRWKMLTATEIDMMDPDKLNYLCERLRSSRDKLMVERKAGMKFMS